MLNTNAEKQAVQEDILTIEVTHFSRGGVKEYDSKFNDIAKKIMLMTWLPSMLPLAIFQVAHLDAAKDSIASVAQTCLSLGLFNVICSLIFNLAMFKSIRTYLIFTHKIENTLKIGCEVDKLVKRTAQVMCGLFLIFSLGVALTFSPITIFFAWPIAFFPSLVLAKIYHSIEKRRLGLTQLIRKIKRRIHDEEKQTWLKLWPNFI
tara:strand:+ start:215 stop:829 length:615 start_codon:yes stop_codon:yes gene_type:complete